MRSFDSLFSQYDLYGVLQTLARPMVAQLPCGWGQVIEKRLCLLVDYLLLGISLCSHWLTYSGPEKRSSSGTGTSELGEGGAPYRRWPPLQATTTGLFPSG